jgi:hypothetical protein
MKGMNKMFSTSNIQHPTSKAQLAGAVDDWMFGVGCWMLDVSLSYHA